MRELYGFHPTFIFDPADSTNRPESGVQTNASIYWSMYPAEVKEVFTKAFTVGLHDSRRRPTFADWQRALGLLQDSIVYCSNCDRQNFYDESKAKLKCWSCASVIKTPLKLRIDDRRFLMLNRDTKLYSYQVTRRGEDPGDRGSPIGEVLKHPKIDVRGLRNLGKKPWRSVNPNGVIASVVPGSSVLLSVGTKIEFEELTAEIEST
jgi:hypothetical protein